MKLFDPSSSNEKIMVIFTDGLTTAGDDPNVVATAAKTQGVIISSIGLSGNGGIDERALRDWASDPDSAYVTIAPDDEELEEIFEDLAPRIQVDCGIEIHPETCPEPIDVTIDGCTDTIEFDAGEIGMESLGRIVQLDVTLHQIRTF